MTEHNRKNAVECAYAACDKLIDTRTWLDKDSDLYKEADSLKQQVEALKFKIMYADTESDLRDVIPSKEKK